MMKCQQVAEKATEFMEGSLSWHDAIRFRLHLWLCLKCRNFLRQLKFTVQVLQHLPRPQISPEAKEILLSRFRKWKEQNHPHE